jgi:hypothetical protein
VSLIRLYPFGSGSWRCGSPLAACCDVSQTDEEVPMPNTRRARFRGRGKERAWWLLAAAALFAMLWAIAQVLEWPVWARATLAGLAAVATLAVPELRARFKQDDTRAALVERAVTVSGELARLPLVRDVALTDLRVHAAQMQVPYVERDVQQKVADALGSGQAVLLVGHSMAGKTRLAAEVVCQRFPAAPLLIPESGKSLRELMGEGLDPAGVVVWLDDLERFLGPDGLTVGLLIRSASPRIRNASGVSRSSRSLRSGC